MTTKIKAVKSAKNQTVCGVEFYEISRARKCDSPNCNSPAKFVHWYGPGQFAKCQKCHDKSIVAAKERTKPSGGKSGAHTPGPWHVVGEYPEFHIAPELAFKNGERWFADKICNRVQNNSDARLIAAAPDLLAALANLLESFTSHFKHGSEINLARKAIAKAKGGL